MKQRDPRTLFVVLFLGLLLYVAIGLAGGSAGAQVPGPMGALPWAPPDPAYKILVTADGLYELGFPDLQAAGVPVDPADANRLDLDPLTLRLFWMGQEMAIRVVDGDDGSLNPGDVLLFYGRGIDPLFYEGLLPANKYTATNVYWLTYGGPNGLRMAEADGSPGGGAPGPFLHTQHLETNYWYFSEYPFEHDADHWYWQWMQVFGINDPPNTASRSYGFTAANVASGTLTGTLAFNLLGYTDGPHHVRVYVNNNLVLDDSTSWNGFEIFQDTADVPQAFFNEGSNSIKVEIVNDTGKNSDKTYTNWFKVSYYDTYVAEGNSLAFDGASAGTYRYEVGNFSSSDVEVYDVGDLAAVQQVTGTTVTGSGTYTVSFGAVVSDSRRFLALTPAARRSPSGIQQVTHRASIYSPLDLLDTGNGADYIIVTHSNFWTQAQRLAAHRVLDYRVALVDAQEIYDTFNGGLMSAEAIHDFLAYTYANWTAPAPAYVVLMGDGAYDMRGYRSPPPTYIPPYLYLADPYQGETAADNRFVTLVNDDLMPDMHLGRLPVSSAQEADDMVDKILAYENGCSCGDWSKNVLFTTDDLDGGGGNFYNYSNRIADGYVDSPTNTVTLLPPSYNKTKAYMGQNCDLGQPTVANECRNRITSTLNYTGALLVSYVGHSDKFTWATERLMEEALAAELVNAPCLPIMVPMTCLEGSFHEVTGPALAESVVSMPVNGAVASWSPTGLGLVSGHDLLEKGLFLAIFHEGVEALGPATTRGKQYLLENQPQPGDHDDLLDTYGLLGDPALKVKGPAACTPTAVRMAGLSARAQGHGVLVSWQTANESDLLGFRVLRGPAPDGEFVPLQEALLFAAQPGSDGGAEYTFFDAQVVAGRTYYYKLEVARLDGSEEPYGLAEATAGWSVYLPTVVR